MKVFGQRMRKKGRSSYQRQFGKRSKYSKSRDNNDNEKAQAAAAAAALLQKQELLAANAEIDTTFQVQRLESGTSRRGWLYNMVPTTILVRNSNLEYSCYSPFLDDGSSRHFGRKIGLGRLLLESYRHISDHHSLPSLLSCRLAPRRGRTTDRTGAQYN